MSSGITPAWNVPNMLLGCGGRCSWSTCIIGCVAGICASTGWIAIGTLAVPGVNMFCIELLALDVPLNLGPHSSGMMLLRFVFASAGSLSVSHQSHRRQKLLKWVSLSYSSLSQNGNGATCYGIEYRATRNVTIPSRIRYDNSTCAELQRTGPFRASTHKHKHAPAIT